MAQDYVHNTSVMSLVLKDVLCQRGKFQLRVDCNFRSNAITTIVGKSGSGKTSLLYTIAGFLPLARGSIINNGAAIHTLKLEDRNIGFIFQDYALFPHMNVFDNIAYGLRIRNTAPHETRKKVDELLQHCELEAFAMRSVNSLSGGQQQRVAIARAIAYKPSVLLCDEALGALEGGMRIKMQTMLQDYVKQNDATLLYVTHNREEALYLGDDILGLEDGQVCMYGDAASLYYHPKTEAAAALLGEYSLIRAEICAQQNDTWNLSHKDWGNFNCVVPNEGAYGIGDTVSCIVRNEHITIGAADQHEPGVDASSVGGISAPARVYAQEFHGFYWRIELGSLHGAESERIQALTHHSISTDTCMIHIAAEHIVPVQENIERLKDAI